MFALMLGRELGCGRLLPALQCQCTGQRLAWLPACWFAWFAQLACAPQQLTGHPLYTAASQTACCPLPVPACSPRGSFANTTGSHECDTCEPGWFAANSGSATCPAGQITVASADAGATECRNCPRGTFRPANATDNKCQT